MSQNTQVRLVRRPVGEPVAEDFEIVREELAEPGEGQVRVEVAWLSLDPAMRGWMDDRPSYIPPVELGAVMRAGGIGTVTASNADGYAVGDTVVGMLGVQEHAVVDTATLYKVDPGKAPLTAYLGTLGMTGQTAYFGLFEVGQAKAGETVVISGAAGAVGSVAGQLAKLAGARVVGIAGGPEKCRHVVEDLGFDACLDYKAPDLAGQLRAATPDRVDVYFDNVGGEILDLVLTRLAMRARVVICGAISTYNAKDAVPGPANYLSLLVHSARMEGFVVFHYAHKYREATEHLAKHYAAGELQHTEDRVSGGVEAFLPTFGRLFSGANTGKLVLEVAGG